MAANQTMDLKLEREIATTFSLAAQQNAYPLIKRLLLTYKPEEESTSKVTSIRVRLTADPEVIAPEEWLIDRLESGQSSKLQQRPLKTNYDMLHSMSEEMLVVLTFDVSYVDANGMLHEITNRNEVNVLPADYWGGESRQAELLAAFVQPNLNTVSNLVSKVAEALRKANQGSAIDGYQSNDRGRPFLFGSALWATLFNERLMYVSPPNGWAKLGQRIRSANDIMTHKTAACLDTSVFFASCFEHMGLNPIIALSKNHAFAGFWLIDENFPVLTNDDPIDLRKRLDSNDILMFETTLVTNDTPVTFTQAIDRAKQLLNEDQENEFVMAIDIRQARSRKIKPLGVIEEKLTDRAESSATASLVNIELPPPLPPVRAEERIIEETPETRVDHWQRKLLDMTKRNPLLNIKPSALKLYCPDLGKLEDMLAANTVFNFVAAEETPLVDKDRDSEIFRLKNGEDLHRSFALDQLDKRTLIVNDQEKRKETKLIELLRKAKNDMEEGGTNTLFLAIGMLRWKDMPESEKTYRAPLILLPVKLERKSANAQIKLRQLPDEEPIFNLTLIEMLQTDYDINLDELREELPKDESGVDVEGIYDIVREAIKEQKGFIVQDDEIVLGSFSFAKYLMWKDLRDRTELLKRSPFVEHLVDNPKNAYQQETSFIEYDQVDFKIKPQEFYAPLNCDSSQMVAVEASSHPQDFVLEGPPGTGKSETIANIISHNLALGRKVLFVAEKMAALQVVYRRMEKIGLGHLCLELHSNKVNKKEVLNQLNNAWSRREAADQSDWLTKAAKLEDIRHGLNKYVTELHKRHAIGLSAREAIARTVRYRHEHPLRLEWTADTNQAPVKSEQDLEAFLDASRKLGVSFSDIGNIDPEYFSAITQIQFSHKWQTDTVALANRISNKSVEVRAYAELLLNHLNATMNHYSISTVNDISALAGLCDLAMTGEIDYSLNTGGSDKVKILEDVVRLHVQLHHQIAKFGHSLSWTILESCHWEKWISQRNEATGIFGFVNRYKLRKAMRLNGLDKISDLTILEEGKTAQETLKNLKAGIAKMNEPGIWNDIDTPHEDLSRVLSNGKRAFALLQQFVATFSDSAVLAKEIRKQLVENRDFLTKASPIAKLSLHLLENCKELDQLKAEATRFNIEVNQEIELAKITQIFKTISDQNQSLNRWCHWLASKKEVAQFGLESLSEALENNVVRSSECEANALTALCAWYAPILIDNSPELVQFAGTSHEATIERFRMLDEDLSRTTAEFIIAKTAGKVPDRNDSKSPSEYGILQRELTKKTRHKPVRQLVNEMGSSLTDLTPCFMMSPLSVAQFLPADFALFDLVVFDEASQITTWDAVGAIARGKNVIVVGDPKQMPPSNNFGRKEEDDSDEGDLESILDQALAARLPHLRLTGHYRSRHETLIAFSNSHYYENQLTTFPSAETKQSAVTLHRIDGVYAKGKGQTNAIEAGAVVKAVVDRLEAMLDGTHTKMSMGIVTINSQQQRLVEDKLDEARRRNPELESFFIATENFDPVFVKNLESVQGDERDIIVLSLTYGPTEAGGRTMSMNFGPLNKQGGERRLNVAVTRATTEVLVFSSFDSSMIDLSRTKATAVEHLKNYLEFAERGPIALAEYTTAKHGIDQFDSEFEKAVALSLRGMGWKVQTQVGVSKFRVDLGIVHPDKPGEYLAGIECDGATYHGSPSARDRDRVRQAILENLGWKIIRLWSTDYFSDPDYSIRNIAERLEALLTKDRASTLEMDTEQSHQLETNDYNESDLNSAQDVKKHPKSTSDFIVETLPKVARVMTIDRNKSDCSSDVLDNLPAYSKERYFEDSHRINLAELAKAILEKKNGITLHELTSDVASKHGLGRSTKKQRQHLRDVLKDTAGFWRKGEEKTTVWLSPNDICDEISWRGFKAFGKERAWESLCYQEQNGVARSAIAAQPEAPVEWLFQEFQLSRRHSSTADVFMTWIDRIRNEDLL